MRAVSPCMRDSANSITGRSHEIEPGWLPRLTGWAILVILWTVRLRAGLHSGWCVMGLIVGLAAPVWGAPPEVTLEVNGPDGCSSSREVARRLEGYLERTQVVLGGPAEGLPSVRIGFVPEGGDVRVDVWVRDPAQKNHRRTLKVPNCEEAALAATFVAAVLLDPSRREANTPGGPKDESSSVAPAPSEPRGSDETAAPEVPAEERMVPEEPRVMSEAEKRRRARRRHSQKGELTDESPDGTIAVVSAGDWGPAPNLLIGVGVVLRLTSPRSSLWAPHAEVQLSYEWSEPALQAVGDAWFDLAHLALRFCPSQLRTQKFRMGACLSVRGGGMWVRSGRTLDPTSVVRPWLDLGPSISASVGLWGPVWLTGGAGASFPLVRDEFQFDSAVFHDVAPVGGMACIGLGLDIF